MALAKASKASPSVSKAMTQLWAKVPATWMPSHFPASTLEVPLHPPMYAARLAENPPSSPGARRSPNSNTGSPWAASTTRAALVAIRLW